MIHEEIPLDGLCSRATPWREPVSLICDVRQGTRPWKRIRLDDISQTGFRIAWMPDVRADEPLRLRIPNMQLLTADIRWRQGNAMGCAFVSPLHIAVFEHLVARSRGL